MRLVVSLRLKDSLGNLKGTKTLHFHLFLSLVFSLSHCFWCVRLFFFYLNDYLLVTFLQNKPNYNIFSNIFTLVRLLTLTFKYAIDKRWNFNFWKVLSEQTRMHVTKSSEITRYLIRWKHHSHRERQVLLHLWKIFREENLNINIFLFLEGVIQKFVFCMKHFYSSNII